MAGVFGAIVTLLIGIHGLELVQGAKLVILPFPGVSHVSQATNIGEALVEEGHEVYMILPTSYPLIEKQQRSTVRVITNYVVEKDMYSYNLGDILKVNRGDKLVTTMRTDLPGFEALCTNLLSDEKLFAALRDLKADLFLMDSLPHSHCAYVLPHRLKVPYVSYGSSISPQWLRAPALPSHVPFLYGYPYTENMTFWERLDNLISNLQMAWFPAPRYNSKDWSSTYAPEKPPISLEDLVRKSSFWFIHSDIIVDYPRPTMPNEAFIGGLTTGPAKPLPADLEAIVNVAEHGVIVFSFGSSLPDLHSERFLKVFSRFKQVVIWRHLSEYEGDTPVPKNVHMLKWLPQNDLLGHNNTRLFITHGGSNGQFEALYHGVPMISFPTFAEQPYNAKRLEYHGFGRALHIRTFSEYDLFEAMSEVLNNPSYREKIQHASRLYLQQRRPKETVAYWINHILKYGAQHLMSHALEMPWYTYWMLDVIAFLSTVPIIAVTLCYCMCKRCRTRQPNKDKTQKAKKD